MQQYLSNDKLNSSGLMIFQVEAALMSSKFVENVMVYADPFNSYCVALVVPSRQVLEGWANESGIKYNDFPELCEKAEAKNEVQQSLVKVCSLPFLEVQI